MKENVGKIFKSIKAHLRITVFFNIVIGILLFCLIGLVVYLLRQNYLYLQMLSLQVETYKVQIQELQEKQKQAVVQELKTPFKQLGKFTLSWYSPKELGKETPVQLRTSKGLIPKEGRTIAVDPKVIPYGSIVYIENYGVFIAEDCGGAIKQNRIDIFTASYDKAVQMGKKSANVWILGKV